MKAPAKQDRILIIVALILAVITYHYISRSVLEKQRFEDPSYRLIKLTAKTVPVKVRFSPTPPEGYRLVPERVEVTPEKVTVIGPEALLEETEVVETAIVDISQTKRKKTKTIPLESVSGIQLSGDSYLVEVVIPIEKLEEGS